MTIVYTSFSLEFDKKRYIKDKARLLYKKWVLNHKIYEATLTGRNFNSSSLHV